MHNLQLAVNKLRKSLPAISLSRTKKLEAAKQKAAQTSKLLVEEIKLQKEVEKKLLLDEANKYLEELDSERDTTSKTTNAAFGIDPLTLQNDLDWLAAHISKQEAKLEDLPMQIFSETNPTRKLTLQNILKFNKRLVETARHDWEQASIAFGDKTEKREDEAMMWVRKAYEGSLEITDP
ncbi:hypothetical protein SLS59_006542 [Nothophoma quercina]|uniref:Altered inheritance of mitochondria protein 41 n=1 Tax=Nothophoma quercina TaxID=749835 RepID=A0ABR3R3S6_9PLEO